MANIQRELTGLAAGLADKVCVNENHRNGIGSSIATAAAVCRDSYDAMIVALADQPLVTAEHLHRLIAANAGARDRISVTKFAQTYGPPALFGGDFFDQLVSLEGDNGAKPIIQANTQALDPVPFESAAIDIDTRDDLSAFAANFSTQRKPG